MPKRIKPPEDKIKNLLIANIEYECSIRGISREQQRLIVQCSQPTYDAKRKNPGKFTVDELLKLAKRLNTPIEKLFTEKVYQ